MLQLKMHDFSCLTEISLITEGETSEEFYFYTLPTSPPSDLACDTTYDTLSLTWSDPTMGMVENTTYQFSYNLLDSNQKFSLHIDLYQNHKQKAIRL